MQITDANRAPNLLPITIGLAVFLWLFTMTGGGDIFVKEVLGGAYDSQAEHFLQGDVGVDAAAIGHEMMIVNGKVQHRPDRINLPLAAKEHAPVWVVRRMRIEFVKERQLWAGFQIRCRARVAKNE